MKHFYGLLEHLFPYFNVILIKQDLSHLHLDEKKPTKPKPALALSSVSCSAKHIPLSSSVCLYINAQCYQPTAFLLSLP